MKPYLIKIAKSRNLPPIIDAEISQLDGRRNFKPHIGLLPGGELLMYTAHGHSEERTTAHTAKDSPRALSSHVVLYRSSDGGRTWSWGRHIREMIGGHEPSVSVIDGIVFVLCHFQGDGGYPDPYAERDYPYSVIFRSSDGGATYERTYMDREFLDAREDERISIGRNVLGLEDGSLLLCVAAGKRHISCHSGDMGLTWKLTEASVSGCRYEGIQRSFFTEALLFHTNSKRLMMMSRVDYAYTVFDSLLYNKPDYSTKTDLDNFDGTVLFESKDCGLTWLPVMALGFPGLMYPSIVNLEDGKMLFTYTVREIPPDGTGCIYPKVGVQAVVIEEKDDGTILADLMHDVIVIDDSTPRSMRNAGCFGNTLLLPDGYFLTPFSYPLIDPAILELADNREYMKEEVFNRYAAMQETYAYRYRDFLTDDPALTELYLRRAFSALFLYARCANMGGIATAAVRWRF